MYHTDHKTFVKGNIALTKVIADLTIKGYQVLLPICEQQPYDLVTYKDNQFRRIQVKYSASEKGSHEIRNRKHQPWSHSSVTYPLEVFDYYAVYLPELDKIVYPANTFGGKRIRTQVPNHYTPYLWYEDFLDFTDHAEYRTNVNVDWTERHAMFRENHRKECGLAKLTNDELNTLVWSERPDDICAKYHIKRQTLSRYCQEANIAQPDKKYWILRSSGYSHEDAMAYKKKETYPQKSLTKEEIKNILMQVESSSRSLREIAREHKVCHQTVIRIRDGLIYKNLIAKIREEASLKLVEKDGSAPS